MIPSKPLKRCLWEVVGVGVLAVMLAPAPARAQSAEWTNITVVVKEAESGQPVANARLTLQFRELHKIGRDKPRAFSAKTNVQGRYKFQGIPKGPIRLLVTAEHRQSYGKDLVVSEDDQVFEVKLKKPQPLL